MPFEKGSKAWMLRTTPKAYRYTAQELIETYNKYVDYVFNNPFYEQTLVRYKDRYEKAAMEKQRPLTISGFCLYAGITMTTFGKYRTNTLLADAAEMIYTMITTHQFEGAAAGIYQHQIIGKALGLSQKIEVTNRVDDMGREEVLSELDQIRRELEEFSTKEALPVEPSKIKGKDAPQNQVDYFEDYDPISGINDDFSPTPSTTPPPTTKKPPRPKMPLSTTKPPTSPKPRIIEETRADSAREDFLDNHTLSLV